MSLLSDLLPSGGTALVYKRELFTADGTWTKSANIWQDQIFVTAVGGGGGGASGTNATPGNGGEYLTRVPIDVSGTSSETVTIGQGGANTGADGGTTSFGAFISVSGGSGGSTGNVKGLIGTPGGFGSPDNGQNTTGVFAAQGGVSNADDHGGGAGLALSQTVIKAGDSADGGGGYGYGAGGASADPGTAGAGADGAVLVEWYEEV